MLNNQRENIALDNSQPAPEAGEVLSNPLAQRRGYGGQEYAKGVVRRAVEEGRLPRPSTLRCIDCGERADGYDHRDYHKPLEVQPVCRGCNRKRGSAANNDRPFFNGIDGVGYARLWKNDRKEKLVSAPEKTVREFIDEHWTTWSPDWDVIKANQEMWRGKGRWRTSFTRGLYDWFGVERA